MARKKNRLVKTSLYLEANSLKKLKQVSKETMIPMAALLRKAIDQVIREHKK